jgi:hypothetical protein
MEEKHKLQKALQDRKRFLEAFPQVRVELEERIRKIRDLADNLMRGTRTAPSPMWWSPPLVLPLES